ncbi:cation-translocating P-type ATPase [[Eubacterium] cellulosolvens]
MKDLAWHTMQVNQALKALNSTVNGLSETEAKKRLKEYGPNELSQTKRISPFKIFVSQFKNILIIILLFATILSAVIGELIDAIVIVAIVFVATILGFTQEYRAERALEALKRILAPIVTVVRNGEEMNIFSREIVPGDILILNTGDRVAADARLIESINLQVNEAPLTGESLPVHKDQEQVPQNTPLPERHCMLFTGTTLTYGRGKAVVTSTGMSTEFGQIAKEVTTVVGEKPPLEIRMHEIGKLLGILALTVCFAVAGVGVLEEYIFEGSIGVDFLLEITLFAIALSVAAVPEALPAIVTGSLAIGMREMAKRNALVRKMSAVETLGSTTVICTDKTGTLTKGEMTVRKIYSEERSFNIKGVGYEPKGEITDLEGSSDAYHNLQLLMEASILCNDAKLEFKSNRWTIKGDPTEGALIVVAEKAGFNQDKTRSQYPRIGEIPFSSERKRMSTIHQYPKSEKIVFAKGAPEVVIERCTHIQTNGRIEPLTAVKKSRILQINEDMAASALRVLALAYKKLAKDDSIHDEETLENHLVFIGIVGMQDPPREEAIEAVKVAKKVKMIPIMITGDHKLTAVSIAKEMGIFENGDIALSGEDMENLIDEEFDQIVERVKVYARVSPIDKLKIVKAWKKKGHIVAMTGDGINDAPAIKHADIGISMGVTGTDVTKEAADMVLADDNFATIIKAIERGRWTYDNIKKYLTYLLQANIVEIIVLATGIFLTLPLYREFLLFLLPAQILYINLATDGLPALALGLSPPDPDLMQRPPRDPKETVFTKDVKLFLFSMPLIMCPILIMIFFTTYPIWGLDHARTVLFLMFIFFELTVALNCRSLKHSIFKARPHRFLLISVVWETILIAILIFLPFTREAFHLTIPTLEDILIVIPICIVVFIALEAVKILAYRKIADR